MCWSLEVSLATCCVVYPTVLALLYRNATPRDRWNAIFLAVFGSMQAIDAALWYVDRYQPLKTCSELNRQITRMGLWIIQFEPVSCLVGRMVGTRELCSWKEFAFYLFTFIFLPALGTYLASGNCAEFDWGATRASQCTQLSPHGHLLLGMSRDSSGGNKCWKQYFLFGEFVAEIPLFLRFLFLVGCAYPYVFMKPRILGFLHIAILSVTWMVGFFSDSHASMWCMANVAQAFLMLVDPYLCPPVPVAQAPVTKTRVEIHEQRFSSKLVPQDLDVIIVGSGIGGLATAALLSRAGKKVLVLEQHYRAGGCTHTFDELGGNLFDSGIHYVGAPSESKFMLDMLTDEAVTFAPMGSAADNFKYDEFDFGDGKRYSYHAGTLEKDLLEQFPEEKAAIAAYFKALKKSSWATKLMVFMRLLPASMQSLVEPLYKGFMESASKTAKEVVGSMTKNKTLEALLSGGQLIDWNMEPDRVSWWVVASMMNYYDCGGFYPEGGSHVIAQRIIPVIERAGGKVLCRASVATIITEEKGATGVRLKSGEELFAPLIISGVGAQNTFTGLLSEEALAQYKIKVPKLEPSHGHMTAFVSLDGPCENFDLKPWNIHSFPELPQHDYDISKLQRAFYDKPFEHPGCLVTLTCPAAKDPLYSQHYPNTSNVLLLTEANIDWFDEMQTGHHGNRQEEYTEFKGRFEKLFLDRLFFYYPKCKGHVTRVDIGSPLTTNYYLNTQRGESYGLAWSPDRLKREMLDLLHPVTPIPHLLMTGESTLFGGFVGAMMSGFVTTLKILGWFSLLKVLLFVPAPVEPANSSSSKVSLLSAVGSSSLKWPIVAGVCVTLYSFTCNAYSVAMAALEFAHL